MEERHLVSDDWHEGRVVQSRRFFAWARMSVVPDMPDDVKQKFEAMNKAVQKKARQEQVARQWFRGPRRTGADCLSSGGQTADLVYIGMLDLVDKGCILSVGSQVAFKLYMDNRGVGGCEVTLVDRGEAPSGTAVEVAPEGTQEIPKSLPPSNSRGESALCGVPSLAFEDARSQPRYLQRWATKVAEEERRMVSDLWYDGEVMLRTRNYAWVKPLDPSEIPDDVRVPLAEMNERFRKKAEDSSGKQFCGGTSEDVVYVGSPDLATKGSILCVGMKVKFKLYVDKKGVGACEVIVSEDHVGQVIDAIHKNFATADGLRKMLHPSAVFGSEGKPMLDVLFVGECDHAFTVAAGRLCGVLPGASCENTAESAPHSELGSAMWCSTELRWPSDDCNIFLQLAENLKTLRSCGVWCSEGIDAHRLHRTLERAQSPCLKFDTVFWMMPYMPNQVCRTIGSIPMLMHHLILTFVSSAAAVLRDEEPCQSSVVVVVSSRQLLSWDLRHTVPVSGRQGWALVPEVKWFDVSLFERHGYQSRFGDGRDRYVEQPVYSRLFDVVAIRWQLRKQPATPSPGEEGGKQQQENVPGNDPAAPSPEDSESVSEAEILERKNLWERVGHDPIPEDHTDFHQGGVTAEAHSTALTQETSTDEEKE